MDSLLENLMPRSQLQAKRGVGKIDLLETDLKEWSEQFLPWKSVKYRAHSDDFKKLLWPEMKSGEEFRMMRDDYARQGLSDVYSQEILNVPMDVTNSFFKRADFVPFKAGDSEKNMIYYAACDLAVSQSQRSDYSAFVVGGMDQDGILHCKHVIRERLDALEIVDTILMLQKVYQPVMFGIEKGTINKAIGPYLNEAMIKTGIYVNTYELSPAADKLTRARSIQARMRTGACKFDKDAEWYPDFEDELLKFPRDRHDDQVDCWAYLGLMIDKMWQADTPQEQEEEEYEQMVTRGSMDHGAGRSATTGY